MKERSHKNWFSQHKVLTVIIIIVVLAGIGAIGNGNKSNKPVSTPQASSNTANKAVPGINQAANDGKFQFTVASLKCGVAQVVDPDMTSVTSDPQGQYCLMDLTVTNVGTQAQSFEASEQYIYSADNKQYSSDTQATILLQGSGSQFAAYPTINPGVSISGTLVYDIPVGQTPATAMLHDSSLSNGVKVNLQ